MAASDLCAEILKDGTKLDFALEKRIYMAFVKQLVDASLDVQGNAVKCIARVASKIQEANLGDVAKQVSEQVIKGSPECRDIYSTCCKSIISEVKEQYSPTLIPAFYKNLVLGMKFPHLTCF